MSLDPKNPTIEALPTDFGVYCLYGAHGTLPLYIGKSCHIKQRIQSHIAHAKVHARTAKMLAMTERVETHRTTGEMGALLLEATLIKQQLPIFNRQLRRTKRIVFIRLEDGPLGPRPSLVRQNDALFVPNAQYYGLFRSEREANQWLHQCARTHRLCLKALGLEGSASHHATQRPCFGYQLKQCNGVCVDKESILAHHRRLSDALTPQQHTLWPYPSRIIAIETHPKTYERCAHYIDQWRYLGARTIQRRPRTWAPPQQSAIFDRDHYHILRRFLTQPLPATLAIFQDPTERTQEIDRSIQPRERAL